MIVYLRNGYAGYAQEYPPSAQVKAATAQVQRQKWKSCGDSDIRIPVIGIAWSQSRQLGMSIEWERPCSIYGLDARVPTPQCLRPQIVDSADPTASPIELA
jgi:hypothetical protein